MTIDFGYRLDLAVGSWAVLIHFDQEPNGKTSSNSDNRLFPFLVIVTFCLEIFTYL